MKSLAQYLAEYLDYEHDKADGLFFVCSYPDGSVYFDIGCLKDVLEQGIDAYQSTEDCKIEVERVARERDKHHYRLSSLMLVELLDAAREIVGDFNFYGEVLQQGDNGRYGTDSSIGRLSAIVTEIDNK